MDVVCYIRSLEANVSVDESFKATGVIDVVDNDTREIKSMSIILPMDEFVSGINLIGKIIYAKIEIIDEDIMVWFDTTSPFEDNWREAILESHIEQLNVVESSG